MTDEILNNSIFKKIQNFLLNNIKILAILSLIILAIFILFQIYLYLLNQNIKKNSIVFFETIENNEIIIKDFEKIKNDKSIFSTLSTLNVIKKNNEKNNFKYSAELYRKLVETDKLNILYKSSISVHASYTLIDAGYFDKSNDYNEDISFFINNISDDLEDFYSIKKELQYLSIILQIDLNNSDYKNDITANKLYNEITNSELISSSVKERVKNIHEFQLYN